MNKNSITNLGFPKLFFGLSSFQMLAMFRRGLFYTYLSIYLRYFLNMSVTETTLFATLPMILNVGFQMFVWGVISDKFQLRRTLVVVGEVFAGIGTLGVFFMHRFVNLSLAGWVIILGLSGVEIFWSMSNSGWTALLSDLFPYEQRNDIQGKLSSLGGLGRIGGVWLGGLLYNGLELQYEGWGFYEGSLFFTAGLVMFISVIPMLKLPEGGVNSNQDPPSIGSAGNDIDNPEITSALTFIIFILAMIFLNFGRNSVAIILPQYLYLDSGFGISSEILSYVTNTQSLSIILTGVIVGSLGKRIGIEKTLFIGSVLSIIALVVIAFANQLLFIFIGNFVRGMADVIVSATSYAFVSRLIAARQRARLFGVYNATFFLSWGLAGTFVSGPITDYLISIGTAEVLSYQTAFLAASLLIFIGLIIFLSLVLLMKKIQL